MSETIAPNPSIPSGDPQPLFTLAEQNAQKQFVQAVGQDAFDQFSRTYGIEAAVLKGQAVVAFMTGNIEKGWKLDREALESAIDFRMNIENSRNPIIGITGGETVETLGAVRPTPMVKVSHLRKS